MVMLALVCGDVSTKAGHGKPRQAMASHNKPRQATASHNKPRQAKAELDRTRPRAAQHSGATHLKRRRKQRPASGESGTPCAGLRVNSHRLDSQRCTGCRGRAQGRGTARVRAGVMRDPPIKAGQENGAGVAAEVMREGSIGCHTLLPTPDTSRCCCCTHHSAVLQQEPVTHIEASKRRHGPVCLPARQIIPAGHPCDACSGTCGVASDVAGDIEVM